MKKNFFIKIIAVALILNIFLLVVGDVALAGNARSLFKSGLDKTADKTGHVKNINLASYVGQVASYILTFLGIIFLGLTIYGGYIWMIARGNEQMVEKAKETLRNVVIGLVIILAAYAITFWISQALGTQTISGFSS